MPFRPARFLPSRTERTARKLYSAKDDADKREFIKTLFNLAPCVHVGEFVMVDAREFPRIAKSVVFHVPTGKFRTDNRTPDVIVPWLTTNLLALQVAFRK
jgi:hypothetical protein